jgi:hypothetical protein
VRLDFPNHEAKYIFTIMANKRGILFFIGRKKAPGPETRERADRNKLVSPVGKRDVINPFLVGYVVALHIELDCHIQLIHAGSP